MAASADSSKTGLVNLERELVCFICTEVLYQPLTLIDCLHSFCGACLKEWFSHQHRKASSSHSSSTSTSPYTCPVCRATVKDTSRNAMVNTFLEMFLTANPDRNRSVEEREEMDKTYKAGDNIMPKVEPKRRERRSRRDDHTAENRERRMVEEARERSLRDMQETQSGSQDTLQLPTTTQQGSSSRSRDREGRRERRRDQGRHDRRPQHDASSHERQGDATDTEQQGRDLTSALVPASSPRHPEAVEERQRRQTVTHQASLASIISSSESGTGSNSSDSLTRRIMQEILSERLGLEGVDLDALTEIEEDALAERIAEAYHQRRRERNRRNNPSVENEGTANSRTNPHPSSSLQVEDHQRHQRTESSGRHRRADTMPSTSQDRSAGAQTGSARAHTTDVSNSLPPPTSIVVTHRRRTSSQGQRGEGSRNRSRRSSPTARSDDTRSRSAANVQTRSSSQDRSSANRVTGSDGNNISVADSSRTSRGPETRTRDVVDTTHQGASNGVTTEPTGRALVQSTVSPRQRFVEPISSHAASSRPNGQQSNTQNTGHLGRRASGLYDEPSISCFRCHRSDIQYEVYRHCDRCELDLCHRCYRTGRGCTHWFGFGHAAMPQYESMQPVSSEPMELPHILVIGRQYQRPEPYSIIRSKLAKDGTTIIPLQTTSNPVTRFLEGRFCDRCSSFANSCFWSCDYCNYGEWGFCADCVNTHHCCTHPLLASIHKSFAPAYASSKPAIEAMNPTASELLASDLRPSSAVSQPSSTTSAVSTGAGPLPDFINLVINTHCDICSQAIPPSALRFHCPFHPSPSPTNKDAHGDYDICTPCYQNLVKTNRIKRDDGSAGWRKCPSSHRMIITTIQVDNEGGHRRVVVNDLVGGWKTPEEAMADWKAEADVRREQDNSEAPSSPLATSPDGTNARRFMRTRTDSWSAESASPTNSSPFSSSSRFPPDGGTGLRGVAWWSYFPDDMDKGPNDLIFPTGAEIREIRIHEEYPDWCGGVYAGDRGLLPSSYIRMG